MQNKALEELRLKISEIDTKIVELVKERLNLAEKVGHEKMRTGLPVKAYDIEKKVMKRYKTLADKLGIDEALSEELSKLLIDYACKTQERNILDNARNQYKSNNSPGKALVIGGSGRMGEWFSNFLNSFGYEIIVIDNQKPKDSFKFYCQPTKAELEKISNSADIIAICTPLDETAEMIEMIAETRTDALVFDIASLKTPILSALNSATKKLPNLVSIHPMFGPDIELLSSENILICSLESESAAKRAYELFSQTTANITTTSPEGHDELMKEVLGLSHMVNLIFGLTLVKSNVSPKAIKTAKSTTFNHQLKVTNKVAHESPELYYAIQSLNAFTPELYENIRKSFEELSSSVMLSDKTTFKQTMTNIAKRCDEIA